MDRIVIIFVKMEQGDVLTRGCDILKRLSPLKNSLRSLEIIVEKSESQEKRLKKS